MDPLSDVLQSLKLSGAFLFRAELSAPWCYAIPEAREMVAAVLPSAMRLVRFHIVIAGSCVATISGAAHSLAPGDVILLPHGDAHRMGSAADLSATPVLTLLSDMRHDAGLPYVGNSGTGAGTTLLCGFLGCNQPIFENVLAALPAAIVERSGVSSSHTWFDAIRAYVTSSGASAADPGLHGMQQRLIELMFVEVLRRHFAELPDERRGWLAALRDPGVGRALAELHAEPGRVWTVSALARRVGLSRSMLAARFRSATGATPMQYLASWRVQLAAGLLHDTELSIADAAARVGYRSEAAFFRAFKRVVGESPAAWRSRSRPSSTTIGA